MARQYGHFINGKEIQPSTGRWIERVCPANGELVAKFAEGVADEVILAIKAARQAFDIGPWPRMTGQQRSQLIQAFSERIRTEKERLAQIEVEEVGKPIRFARQDIEGVVALTSYAAGLAMQMHGDAYTSIGDQKLGLIVREPIGVVGMVTPWNFPALIFAQKMPFALAAGCTCVAKPSELTSGTALELAKLAHEVGIPAGVVNVVTGYGDPVGEELMSSPLTDMSSFTGSTPIGRRVIQNSIESIKKVAVELGGKAANIVFADADLDDAVDGTMMGIFFNQGEVCCSGTRLIIEESIADDFMQRLVEKTANLKVGDPFDDDTDVGAMIHKSHMESVLGMIEKGQQEGAELLLGGQRMVAENSNKGFFVAPTIFDRVSTSMSVFREEIFGPVLSTTRFKTESEAITLANDTEYGLANGVWSKDIGKILRVTRALKSGTVWANTMIDGAPQLPFGGYKASGFGREMGQTGFDEFTEIKTILLNGGARSHVFS